MDEYGLTVGKPAMSHALFRVSKRQLSVALAAVTVAGSVPVLATSAAAAPVRAEAARPAAADCGAQPDEWQAMSAALLCGTPVENLAARSETGETVANPDGTWTAKIYAGQVRMRDDRGTLVTIDTTLRAAADGSVAPVAHPGGLRLSGAAGEGRHELLSIDVGGERVSLGWTGRLPAPSLDGSRATYAEIRPGVDLVVQADRTGVEQFFVVKNREAAAAVTDIAVPITADGLTIAKDGDGGLLFKEKDVVVGTSPTPEMWDSSIDPATGGPKRIAKVPAEQSIPSAGRATVALRPDRSFFADPATVYPVVVDPQINPLGVAFDTYVREGESVDRSGANDLQSGLTSGDRTRSFVQWDTSRLVGRQVTSATINLYNWYSQSLHRRTVGRCGPPARPARRPAGATSPPGRPGRSPAPRPRATAPPAPTAGCRSTAPRSSSVP
ncbi:hypothetical protein JCM9533A_15700 [Catenuloplanes niger JCM 9533]